MKKPQQHILSHSIGMRLLQSVFAFYFGITLLLTSWQLWEEYASAEQSLERELDSLDKAFSPSLAEALWTVNRDQVESILQGMNRVPVIAGVRVTDSERAVMGLSGAARTQQPVAQGARPYQSRSYTIVFQNQYQAPTEVGQLTLYMDPLLTFKRAQRSLLFILINSLLKSLALWVIIFAFVRKIIVIPLGVLADILQSPSDWPKLDQHERLFAEHELRQLYQSFKAMSTEIQGNIKTLEEKVQSKNEKFMLAQQNTLALGASVAEIAHDIANPVHLIQFKNQTAKTHLETIKETIQQVFQDSQDQDALTVKSYLLAELQKLQDIQQDVKVSIERVDHIQRAIRIQARQDLEREDHYLSEIIEESLLILQVKIRQLQIKVDCPPEFSLYCMRHQIGRVLTNLLGNAIDALEERKDPFLAEDIALIIRVLPNVQPGISYIEVEDAGAGIPDAIKAKLFHTQFTSKAVGKGTGLGLTLSRKIIQDHGGELEIVPCRQLQGTCFRITWNAETARSKIAM